MEETNDLYQAPNADISSQAYCRQCGKQIPKTANYCPHCNAKQISTEEGRNKTTAALLALFLGGLGIHRFYLGQWWGIFYFLLWPTGIPSLISLIEFCVFLLTSQDTWNNKYGDKKGSSAIILVIAVVALFFILIPIIGILAAVAIPAYRDYGIRAKAATAFTDTVDVKNGIEKYWVTNEQLPNSEDDLGYDYQPTSAYLSDIDVVSNGVVVVTIGSGLGVENLGKTITFTPQISDIDGQITWDCSGGDFEMKYRPSICRY